MRASEQDRPDIAERREAKSLGGRLIFLDELDDHVHERTPSLFRRKHNANGYLAENSD